MTMSCASCPCPSSLFPIFFFGRMPQRGRGSKNGERGERDRPKHSVISMDSKATRSRAPHHRHRHRHANKRKQDQAINSISSIPSSLNTPPPKKPVHAPASLSLLLLLASLEGTNQLSKQLDIKIKTRCHHFNNTPPLLLTNVGQKIQ